MTAPHSRPQSLFPDSRSLLVGLLIRVSRAYVRFSNKSLAGLALSQSTALAVMLLGRMGNDVRQVDLAEALDITGASMVPLVEQIVRAGLAERRPHPTDRRVNTLHLTDAGRELAAQAEAKAADNRAKLCAGIAEDDLKAAIRVLTQLEAALARESAEG